MTTRSRILTGLVGLLLAAVVGITIYTSVCIADLYSRVDAIPDGPRGRAATITIGTTTTGNEASVTNAGTTNAAILDFVLLQGAPGASYQTVAYVSNVVTSGATSNTTYATLNSLVLATNQTFLLAWNGVVTNTFGSAALRWRIASPPGTIIGQSNRQMSQAGDSCVSTSAIYSVTAAPQTLVLEWSVAASPTTYTIALNHFYAVAVGSGAVTP